MRRIRYEYDPVLLTKGVTDQKDGALFTESADYGLNNASDVTWQKSYKMRPTVSGRTGVSTGLEVWTTYLCKRRCNILE